MPVARARLDATGMQLVLPTGLNLVGATDLLLVVERPDHTVLELNLTDTAILDEEDGTINYIPSAGQLNQVGIYD